MNVSLLQRHVSSIVIVLAQVVFVIFFVRYFLVDVGRINGTSMIPTLDDDQIFMVNRLSYLFAPPERFDIVQLFHPVHTDRIVVKRVVGLPGEVIHMRQGDVYITTADGQEALLEEPHLAERVKTFIVANTQSRIELPEHHYFMLGDNRRGSIDSRHYGIVHRKFITGSLF